MGKRSKMNSKIAVIGAGIAGCTVARELAKSGLQITLFEKSRGAGGRMSSRRAESLSYDHGAPSFEAMSAPFRNEVETWIREGWAARWTDLGFRVGVPTMSALPRRLTEMPGIECRFGVKVESLQRSGDRAWEIVTTEGRAGPFSDVIITAPAPQALELIGDRSSALSLALSGVRYEPCWMLLLSVRSGAPDQAALDGSRSEWGGVFSRITEESSKPGRQVVSGVRSYAFQALPSWSAEHLEASAERVLDLLLPAALRALGAAPSEVVDRHAHRWRYARVVAGAGKAFVSDTEAGLHACGDAFTGDGVENAWMSALSLSRIQWKARA